MAEYIKREDVKKRIKELLCIPGDDDEVVKYIQKQILNKLPSIDIVTCRECKWAGRDDHCPAIEVYIICGDNGYCSCGERKE